MVNLPAGKWLMGEQLTINPKMLVLKETLSIIAYDQYYCL